MGGSSTDGALNRHQVPAWAEHTGIILIDKFGPQKVLAFGIISFASGIFLMSNPTSELTLFSATTLMGFGLGGAGMATMVSIAGKVAPVNKRSLAMGLVAAAASFGQFAVVQIISYKFSGTRSSNCD